MTSTPSVDAFPGRASKPETVCYCRVSFAKQRGDLQRQCAQMRSLYPNAEIIRDIGGGLNWKRKGLLSILERIHRGDKLTLVVAHRDRLARFGFELIEWLVQQNGGQTNPAAGVIATSPEIAPDTAPMTLGLLLNSHEVPVQAMMPAAAAVFVTTKAFTASPLGARALPALNPNQPNQSSPAPRTTNGTWCGIIRSSP